MVISILLCNCNHVYIVDKKTKQLDYDIIKRDWFVFEDFKTDTVYSGHILLKLPDTIVTYYEIAQNAFSICVKEDMPYAKFYLTKDCYLKQGKIDNLKVYRNLDCYIGMLDLRSKGLKWKYLFQIDDFIWNKKIPGVFYKELIFDN